MRMFLFVLAILAFLIGFGTFVSAKSAIHEIEGSILLLISAVTLSGAGIIEAIDHLRAEVLAHKS